MQTELQSIVFVWENFGPPHADRCEALASLLKGRASVVGIEICGNSSTYDWVPERGVGFLKETLFTGAKVEDICIAARFWKLMIACRRSGGRYIFLCHYENVATFLTAVVLKCMGRRVYVMNDSKFDDYPRVMWREILKSLFYFPYEGGLAGSARAKDYMRFLGIRYERIEEPYNAISVSRIRRLAGLLDGLDGVDFADRHFTIVARLVPKKNITTAILAYAKYVSNVEHPRQLHVYGSGPLDGELKAQVREACLEPYVHFYGFRQTQEIAQALRRTLALILPSIEEQFGYVVLEALAANVPVIVSSNCGVCDSVVRDEVNGFVVEPMNVEGYAYYMRMLSEDRVIWTGVQSGAKKSAMLGDASLFAKAVERLLEGLH